MERRQNKVAVATGGSYLAFGIADDAALSNRLEWVASVDTRECANADSAGMLEARRARTTIEGWPCLNTRGSSGPYPWRCVVIRRSRVPISDA